MNSLIPNSFIFLDSIQRQLEWMLANPEQIPSPLCFYGFPGNGKTTFAKHLAETVANDYIYRDMNEVKTKGESSGKMLDEIKSYASTMSIPTKDGAAWCKAVILDEWHNATAKQQDAYKVLFEKDFGDNHLLFILCLNTNERKGIDAVLSPAIKSRCHTISFNTKKTQLEELNALVKKRFPQLADAKIRSLMPDMRQIQREAKLPQEF